MIEIKNLHGQLLLSLSDGKILNSDAQTVGMTNGKNLLNLAGQVLAAVEGGCIFRNKEDVLLRVEGSRVVNISGQHIATVENGSEDERALLAAAHLVFLQWACSIALDGQAAIVRLFIGQRTTISVSPSN